MLYLIGLGLNDEKDVSEKGLEAVRNSDSVYYEVFTNNWSGDITTIHKKTGKTIRQLERADIESNLLVDQAKKRVVALLVPGDPLAATTHMHLFMEARKAGVPVRVVHSSSIFTAIAETGLQLYKFGRTTTLPAKQDNYPSSPFDVVKDNQKHGLHSLVLLDICMPADDGLRLLKDRIETDIVVVCCRLGSAAQLIRAGTPEELLHDENLRAAPSVIIVPGKLHFVEEEALGLWK